MGLFESEQEYDESFLVKSTKVLVTEIVQNFGLHRRGKKGNAKILFPMWLSEMEKTVPMINFGQLTVSLTVLGKYEDSWNLLEQAVFLII